MFGISDQQRQQDERSLTKVLVMINSLLFALLLLVTYMKS
jgi:hypothetical protein